MQQFRRIPLHLTLNLRWLFRVKKGILTSLFPRCSNFNNLIIYLSVIPISCMVYAEMEPFESFNVARHTSKPLFQCRNEKWNLEIFVEFCLWLLLVAKGSLRYMQFNLDLRYMYGFGHLASKPSCHQEVDLLPTNSPPRSLIATK